MTLTWQPPEIPVQYLSVTLTPRQADVLAGMCLGLSNFAIGRRLHMAEDTVKSHAKRLYRSLGARDRCHAVALATSGRVDIHVEEGWR